MGCNGMRKNKFSVPCSPLSPIINLEIDLYLKMMSLKTAGHRAQCTIFHHLGHVQHQKGMQYCLSFRSLVFDANQKFDYQSSLLLASLCSEFLQFFCNRMQFFFESVKETRLQIVRTIQT